MHCAIITFKNKLGVSFLKKSILIIILLFIAIQFIRPQKSNPPVKEGDALQAPEKVMHVLRRSCYDCHSNETNWPWYADIAPLSWSIASHVKEGRKALNFSEWKKISKEIKQKRLKRAIKTTQNGMMPLPSYLWLHKDAKLSSQEKTLLKRWFEAELEKL
jgi:hypothetical protein